VVSRPAKVEVFESHRGAETMPKTEKKKSSVTLGQSAACPGFNLAILYENIQALLDQQAGVEDDQAVAQREHIVTRADL
jgi:hypothetical protein